MQNHDIKQEGADTDDTAASASSPQSDDINQQSEKQVYHERQRLQLCLVHTLNSLLQTNCFTKVDLDRIADDLHGSRWFNPHRSMLGIGNYDVNVLIAALQEIGLTMRWFDTRRSLATLRLDRIFGFVFNVQVRGGIFSSWPPTLLWGDRRHWFAVRQLKTNGQFYNLDSKLNAPTPIDDFLNFAQQRLNDGSQMMVVLEPEKADSYMSRIDDSHQQIRSTNQ